MSKKSWGFGILVLFIGIVLFSLGKYGIDEKMLQAAENNMIEKESAVMHSEPIKYLFSKKQIDMTYTINDTWEGWE